MYKGESQPGLLTPLPINKMVLIKPFVSFSLVKLGDLSETTTGAQEVSTSFIGGAVHFCGALPVRSLYQTSEHC